MARHDIRIAALSVALFVLSGCTATPMPEPPNTEPDLDLVAVQEVPRAREPTVRVTGQPGSAPPGAIFWAASLDWWAFPEMTTVADDGSFDLQTAGFDGSELRVQVRDGDRRYDPVDVIVATPLSLATRNECFVLEPAMELFLGPVPDEGATETILAVDNQCGEELVINEGTLHLVVPGIELGTNFPLSIAPGGQGQVLLRLPAGTEPELEEILLLQVTSPFEERRPVTLYWGP